MPTIGLLQLDDLQLQVALLLLQLRNFVLQLDNDLPKALSAAVLDGDVGDLGDQQPVAVEPGVEFNRYLEFRVQMWDLRIRALHVETGLKPSNLTWYRFWDRL